MKIPPPLAAGISVAAVLLIGVVYLDLRLDARAREIDGLRASNAALEAQVSALKASVDGLVRASKQAEGVIGEKGSLQVLARSLASGEMDLALKSLRITSGGKALVTLSAAADQGGVVSVASADGSGSAEISSAPGKAQAAFRTESGSDAAHQVQVATFGSGGFYAQKGSTDAEDSRTVGAGLLIQDSGASLFVTQRGAGTVSIDAPSGGAGASMSAWSDGELKKRISVSLGAGNAVPSVSVAGSPAGNTLWLQPARLSLLARDGTVVLAAAQDGDGGFVFVNDSSGARRALVTAGTEGQGKVSVFGSDKRSNTLAPVYNIQQSGPTQK